MKKPLAFITALVLTVCCVQAVTAESAAPTVSAQSAIVIEKNSGRVLYSKNAEQRLPMASTTKIITAITALEAESCDIDATIEISASAAGVEGSSMYLETGEKMTLRELLYGLMLSSGNDAAVAIAEHTAGSAESFAELMNQKAQAVGANSSHFTNPNGLPDDNHYSTAADMARITAYAMKNDVFAEIVRTKNYKITGEGKAYQRTLTNHNKLLSMYDGCIGVKTGFTKAAGRCLVSAAERDGMTLICVTLNAPSDWSDHAAMLDYGFENYTYTRLADTETPVCAAEVDGSDAGAIPIYPECEICYPLAEGEKCTTETELYPELCAPIAQGEAVGKISVILNGKKTDSAALVAGGEAELVVKTEIETASAAKNFGQKLLERLGAFFGSWLNVK